MEQFLKRIENLLTVKSIGDAGADGGVRLSGGQGRGQPGLYDDLYDGHRVLFRDAGAEAAERRGDTA